MPPRRQSKIRSFGNATTARGLQATQGVLPSGGSLDVSAKANDRVVDECKSHVDRHRVHLSRKPTEPTKLFIPLDPNESKSKTDRGKNLHTDPFDEARLRVTFRRAKAKIATPRGPERAPRRQLHASEPPKNAGAKDGFIVANGVRHTSPKRVYAKSHSTTHQLEQKPKNFQGSQRFYYSPQKGGQALVPQTSRQTYRDAVVAPLALTATKEVPVPIAAATTGAVTYRSISNAFFDQTAVLSIAAPVEERPRPGVRQFGASYAPTMEGVFVPMRDGRVPRPQPAEAPWTRVEPPVAPHGVKMIAARQTSAAPFALQC